MTRAYFSDTVKDKAGVVISGASVRVESPGTGTLISGTIYSGATGAGTLSNPLTTNGSGVFAFYLDTAQTVELAVSYSGKVTKRYTAVATLGATLNLPGETESDRLMFDGTDWVRKRGPSIIEASGVDDMATINAALTFEAL